MLDLSIAPRRAPIYVSILRPSPGERARVSKLITNAGEKVKTDLKVTRFDVELLTANTPADALTMIQRALDAPDSCVVFENPTDIALEALDGQGIARNFRRVVDSNHPDEPRPLIAHEQHTYVNRADLDGLDLDDFGLPPFDATNPDIDTLNTIADALGWTDASFVWEISASQDAGGTNLLRVHLFSINSRPLSNTVRRCIAESLLETLHVDAGAASSRGAVFYNAPEVIDHTSGRSGASTSSHLTQYPNGPAPYGAGSTTDPHHPQRQSP